MRILSFDNDRWFVQHDGRQRALFSAVTVVVAVVARCSAMGSMINDDCDGLLGCCGGFFIGDEEAPPPDSPEN